MSDKLKPCPFCGGDKIRIDDNGTGPGSADVYWARCRGCTALGGHARTRKKAVDAWNRRAEADNAGK